MTPRAYAQAHRSHWRRWRIPMWGLSPAARRAAARVGLKCFGDVTRDRLERWEAQPGVGPVSVRKVRAALERARGRG